MTLPAELRQGLEQSLGIPILQTGTVTGGCISETARLDLANDSRVFVKWAHEQGHTPGLFRCEAKSLRAIAETNTVRVPHVIDVVDTSAGYSFLLLEWLEPGAPKTDKWVVLGAGLANLHHHRAPNFGWSEDNFIGSLPQSNTPGQRWAAFWRDERIIPQLQAAEAQFTVHDRARFDRLLNVADELLLVGDQEGASLLHGDLWSGNVHMLAAGGAAVIDPASYYGHREVDLAMSKLFGGFARDFYTAYEEVWPLEPDAAHRLLMYQLYYLLVHVNLFGASYVPNTMGVVKQLGF